MKKERPEVLNGTTKKVKTSCGTIYITINKDKDGDVIEVSFRMGKSGTCISARNSFEGVILSKLLQSDTSKKELRDFLMYHAVGVNCGEAFVYNDKTYKSCLDLVACELLEAIK